MSTTILDLASVMTLDARPGLDLLIESGPRGGLRRYWRRADRRETGQGGARLVSTWDRTQRAARAR